jgi:hypothetical protein
MVANSVRRENAKKTASKGNKKSAKSRPRREGALVTQALGRSIRRRDRSAFRPFNASFRFDRRLAVADVIGSIAWARGLEGAASVE